MNKWLCKKIEDWGGETSPDYKNFQKDYRKCIRSLCNTNGLELISFSPSHYEFSCFIKNKNSGKMCYMSISDVRYFDNRWFFSILVRTAKHEKDYSGGYNTYCCYDKLAERMLQLTI